MVRIKLADFLFSPLSAEGATVDIHGGDGSAWVQILGSQIVLDGTFNIHDLKLIIGRLEGGI